MSFSGKPSTHSSCTGSLENHQTLPPAEHHGRGDQLLFIPVAYVLTLFVENGRIEIDNNLVENAIRPTALGKKNWLFIGDAKAGDRGAILYSITESCRRRDIDPYAYLRDVLTRLPHMTIQQVYHIIPSAWIKSKTPNLKLAS